MTTPRFRASLFAAILFTCLPSAYHVAQAAPGDLTPQGCIDDADGGADTCAQTADGLDDPRGLAVSPDGRSVYVVSDGDNGLVIFDRDPQTGALTPAGCVDDNDTGNDTCAQSTDGLDRAQSVAVSPDGGSVYVASRGDSAVALFDRDPQTGALAPAGCVDDNDTGGDTCAQSTDGLAGAFAIAVSSDGTSAYATSIDDDAVVVFDRDPSTGQLTPAGCVDDNDGGPDSCVQSTDGLDGAHSVAVSPDGTDVYVTADLDDALVGFDRDTSTGQLTPAGCVDDNDSGPDSCGQTADGLDAPRRIVVTDDGTSVYAASQNDDAVVGFDRDPSTGALTPAGCVDDNDSGVDTCAQSANGLDGALGVDVSPDGTSVYVAAENDDAVLGLRRDAQTSVLTPAGCVDDNDSGLDGCAQSTDGLAGARAVAVSGDGLSAYALGEEDDALVWLGREGADTDPPQTRIVDSPDERSADRTPTFRFRSDEAGSVFECKLDGDRYRPCTSPKTYARQTNGDHTFRVRATDGAGNADPTPAKYTWTII